MRLTTSSLWAIALVATIVSSARADSLAEGDPSTLLNIDDEYVTGLTEPTSIAFLPDGRMVIAEKQGAIKVRTLDGNVVTAGTVPVDSTTFHGLMSLVPHPDYENNHQLYIWYSAKDSPIENRNRVAVLELSADSTLGALQDLVHDFSGRQHNGGDLAIQGDKLLVSVGAGGGTSNAPPGEKIVSWNASCLTNMNGKVLRLNLDGSIPDDNPLLGATGAQCGASASDPPGPQTSDGIRTEIWAWGFRQPFRIWADPKTGNLFVGDVGEITYEEINIVPTTSQAGVGHYGWPYREGQAGQDPSTCANDSPGFGDCKEPAYVCESSQPRPAHPKDVDANIPNECEAIIGGVILDACEWPAPYEGSYVFGDNDHKRIWTMPVNEARDSFTAERADLATTASGGPTDFAEFEGALYAVIFSGAGNGRITRIAPKNPEAPCPIVDASNMGGTAGMGGASGMGGADGMGGALTETGGAGGAGGSDAPTQTLGGQGGAAAPVSDRSLGGSPSSSAASASNASASGCRLHSGNGGAGKGLFILVAGLLLCLRRKRTRSRAF